MGLQKFRFISLAICAAYFLARAANAQVMCQKPELIGIMRGAMHQYGHSPAAAATQMAKDAQRHFGGSWSVVILGPYDHTTSSFSLPSENFCESSQGGHYVAMAGFMGKSVEPEESTGSPVDSSGEATTTIGHVDSDTNSLEEAEEGETGSAMSKQQSSAISGGFVLPPVILALIIASLVIGAANVLAICFLRNRRTKAAREDVVHYATPAPSQTTEIYDIVDLDPSPPVPPRPGLHGSTISSQSDFGRNEPLGKSDSELDKRL